MNPTIEYIVDQYREPVYKLCLGFADTPEEAADLSQEVFLQLWRRLDQFRGEAKFSTWLYRVAVNTCLMHRRKRRLETTALRSDHQAIEQAPSEEKEQIAALRLAIKQLPRQQRAAVILHLEELSHREIGEVLGQTENNVGVILYRAKNKLRSLLKTSIA
ncbi:MAG: sigma-70 family RNA polymerase sigma factor [Bacteroidota bacterium]